MRERLSWLAGVTLPGLNDAVEGVSGTIGAGAKTLLDLGASLSSHIAEAFPRLEWPTVDLSRLPSLSSLPFSFLWPPGPDPGAALASPAAGSGVSPALAAPTDWGSTVGKSGLTWDLFFSNTDHDWSDEVDMGGLVRFLRGRYPEKTAANVAADTRLPVDTVKKWLGLAAAPNGRAMLVLACVYGPEVLVAVLRRPPRWLVETARAAEQVRLEAELAALQAKLRRGPA